MIEVPESDLEEWIGELKPYQREALDEMMEEMEAEEAAKIWLTSQGPEDIISFGGPRDSEPFWDKFKSEFQKFLCKEDEYVEFKKEIREKSNVTKQLLISSISAAIGSTIGFAATLLAPAVAVMLNLVGHMGVNAYCEGVDFETEEVSG